MSHSLRRFYHCQETSPLDLLWWWDTAHTNLEKKQNAPLLLFSFSFLCPQAWKQIANSLNNNNTQPNCLPSSSRNMIWKHLQYFTPVNLFSSILAIYYTLINIQKPELHSRPQGTTSETKLPHKQIWQSIQHRREESNWLLRNSAAACKA